MCSNIPVDRETASKINPIISSLWTEDTLDTVAAIVFELGYMVSETELAKEHVCVMFDAAAAALRWERDNILSVVQARKDFQHV